MAQVSQALVLVCYLVATVLGAGAVVGLAPFLPDALEFVRGQINIDVQVPLATLLIAILGAFLFIFRAKARVYYGFGETIFALASAWVSAAAVFRNPNAATGWVGIVGTAYLLVRGLDNATQGLNMRAIIRLVESRCLTLGQRQNHSAERKHVTGRIKAIEQNEFPLIFKRTPSSWKRKRRGNRSS